MIYYSLYDKSLRLYNPPFAESNDERAKQVVRNLILGSGDQIAKKLINDIDLVAVGAFNDISGSFSSPENPITVCSLSEIPLPEEVI